jgi:hypothetical protein
MAAPGKEVLMRRLSLLLLLVLVPLAAGCGSEPSALQGSDDALNDASSSRVEWKLEGKGVPDWALLRSTGSIDYAHNRGEMVIKGKSDSALEARGLFVGGDAYLGVNVGGTMYWLKESPDDATGADHFMPGPNGTTPERLLKDLVKSSKKVEKLGTEEIRGVTTTHYRAHLDKTKPELGILRDEPGIVDAWIDEQGLPRRIRVPDGGENESAAVFELFDFGVPVKVEAPPANQIVSEDEFDKLMEKECAGAAKDLENMNPVCVAFLASPGESQDSIQVSPTETVPTTEGK